MAKRNIIDLDALIPGRDDEREIQLGGRIFKCPDVPVGIGAAYMKTRVDPTYPLSDFVIDASIMMLNQDLPKEERIDKSWFLEQINGGVLEPITDVILAPFYEQRFQKRLKPKITTIPDEPETTTEPEQSTIA